MINVIHCLFLMKLIINYLILIMHILSIKHFTKINTLNYLVIDFLILVPFYNIDSVPQVDRN